ncbi:apolipoprotein N-acyltransferase [Sphingomonas gilva]|uniref:Apolipoprotein N-acyltransferase n=1 Tax=Sphingomonas gilva TaxID=2305907 RepID=A0A396RPQ1_9SPHN|nr:apolipoprotein N-acyltransferase [Sphingomonas gilva]RHW18564.1 apolipoprotein N-acyltransferase [Sphingomonas gilva]
MTRHPRIAALVLGLISACGFEPLALWPVTLAAFALFMGVIWRAPSLKEALFAGWLFGLAHFSLGLNWIQKAFTYQDAMPHWLGYIAPVLLSVYLAVYPAIAAGLAWRYGRSDRLRFGIVLAAAWIVVELLRATLFTGFPWNPLGAIFVPVLELARASRFIGTYGLSGVAVLAATALFLLPAPECRKRAAILAAALAAIGLTGIVRPTPPPADAPRVLIVQPNIDQKQYPTPTQQLRYLETYERLSRTPSPGPTLILWPEGAIRYLLEDGYPRYAYDLAPSRQVRGRLAQLLGEGDILITGADALIFDENQNMVAARNAIFALGPDGQLKHRYDKAHLVPYGEYLPMRAILEPIGLSRLLPGSFDFIPGPGPRNMALPPFGAGAMQICYEIVFSGEVVDPTRRPAFIFNPSNDSWFGSWGPPQHLAQARLRAIEEGLPVLRSTPTGISALIDSDGRLLASVPHKRQGVIEAPLPPAARPTLFARMGNWLAWGFALALILLAVALAPKRR